MTKEIIIDGVDVSDCMYYEPKAIKMTCHEQAITKPCNTSPICYYKLLHKAYKNCERLEQENNLLKQTLKDKNFAAIVEENEKLKEELQVRDNLAEDFRKRALEWAEIANNYFKENSRLYKILQEIKEIVTEPCIDGENCNTCKSNCTNKDILDLITKAEEE